MGYEKHVLGHFGKPYHKDAPFFIVTVDHTSFGYSHVSTNCGDEVDISVYVLPSGIIFGIWWKGTGCCFSMAAMSMLAKHFEGLSLEDVYTFSKDDMFDLFKAPCPLLREDCVLTGYNALKKLPRSYHETSESV